MEADLFPESVGFAFVFRRDFTHLKLINRVLRRQYNALRRIRGRYLLDDRQQLCNEQWASAQREVSALNLPTMAGAFALLIAGTLGAIFLFSYEQCHDVYAMPSLVELRAESTSRKTPAS